MQQAISLTIYLGVGFVEMILVTQRTSFIARNKRKAAAFVVLIENIITFFVILQLARDVTSNLPNFSAYCVGCCTGTALNIESFTLEKLMNKLKRIHSKPVEAVEA